MDKKLKFNAFLKGVSIFAFVAFCLLAILAGVTLPFVSNASTLDSAVASTDIGEDFIPLSNAVIGTTYYGIYIPDNTKNWTATADDSPYQLRLFNFHTLDTNYNLICYSYKQRTFRDFLLKIDFDGTKRDVQYICETSRFENQYIYDNGFVLDEIVSASSVFDIYLRTSPYIGDVSSYITQIETLTAEKNALQAQLTEKQQQIETLIAENNALQAQLTEKQNQIDTLTAEKNALQSQVDSLTAEKATLQAQLTEKQNMIDTLTAEKATLQSQLTEKQNQIDTLTAEKNALQTQVNDLTDENNDLKKSLGFKSRFGYIGDLKNNQMFLNLRAAPRIPDDIYCPYRNDTLVNYNKKGNDYYLSIVDAYDSNNNVVTESFSGWKFINKKNPDGTPSSFYDFEFFIRDIRIAHIDTVEFVNNCFSTPNYNNIYYLVSTDFLDANYAAYGSDKGQYFYSLRSYLSKDDVRDFFALFDLTYYIPVNDAFYLAGYNNASKGYFDDGYNQGYSVGKDEGYNTGFSAGDAQGFARGVDSANTYSFLGLFGAIFDAPIKAIFGGTSTLPAGTKITDSNGNTITLQSTTTVSRGGLLNFDIMGVNLSGFVLALFSISIIVVVIKFALARR